MVPEVMGFAVKAEPALGHLNSSRVQNSEFKEAALLISEAWQGQLAHGSEKQMFGQKRQVSHGGQHDLSMSEALPFCQPA